MPRRSPPPRPVPATTPKDRFIAKVVAFLTSSVYRDLDVHWVGGPRDVGKPTIWVANHFGGFVDALVLLHVLPTRPGIIARDVIWKIPLAGRLMTWLGAIPVHKPDDGDAAGANDQMFGSCYQALRDGAQLLIFPEGVTRNEPSIARVKTGAARIALGARAAGAAGIEIAPVGIHYEDKAALRSRVVVIGGEPIDVDAFVASRSDGRSVDADDRDVVEALTAEIDAGLRRAAPDYEDWAEARDLTVAADVTVRDTLADPTEPVPIGLRDRLANALADAPQGQRAEVRAATAAYRAGLESLGMTDVDVVAGGSDRRVPGATIGQLLTTMVLLPFAVVGAVINAIPIAVVKAVGALRVAPSVLSSIKPIVAFVMFGAAWAVVIWWAAGEFGVEGGAAAFVLMPVYLAALFIVSERVVSIGATLARRRQGTSVESLLRHRRDVVDAVVGLPRAGAAR